MSKNSNLRYLANLGAIIETSLLNVMFNVKSLFISMRIGLSGLFIESVVIPKAQELILSNTKALMNFRKSTTSPRTNKICTYSYSGMVKLIGSRGKLSKISRGVKNSLFYRTILSKF